MVEFLGFLVCRHNEQVGREGEEDQFELFHPFPEEKFDGFVDLLQVALCQPLLLSRCSLGVFLVRRLGGGIAESDELALVLQAHALGLHTHTKGGGGKDVDDEEAPGGKERNASVPSKAAP